MLGEILRRRGARAVTWFHADHWEPWGQGVNDASVARVESFTHQAKNSRFAGKMTLFYLAGNQYRLKEVAYRSKGEEILEAIPRPEHEHNIIRQLFARLRAQTNVEFQLHLHHEHLVGNDGEYSDLHREIKILTDREQDARRLQFLVRNELGALREHAGGAFEKWAFVHGMWALNGSDRNICQIDNEIEILMQHGCWGDFSFPAGRGHCDPRIFEQPYTCKPFAAPKGYDNRQCDPIAVDVGAASFREGRFLIWNSKAKHEACSLDYYSPRTRERLKNADHVVFSWLADCPIIDDVLYVKTHAHSMDARYFEGENIIPLATPDMRTIFNLLERACDEAKVELKLATVDEVATVLRDVDARAGSPQRLASSTLDETMMLELQVGSTINHATAPSFSLTNLFAVSILTNWLALDPIHERAAGSYYMARLSQRRLFVDAELAIAKYSQNQFDRKTRFVELGFGFGELSLLLALSGFPTTGFESDIGRCAGAKALIDKLGQQGLEISGLSLVEGLFPDSLRLEHFDRESEAVFVSTNVTSSHVMGNFTHILRTLRLFDHAIIDLTRFGMVRDEQSQKDLIADLRRAGFSEVGPVYSTSDTDVRHFERKGSDSAIAVSVDDLRYSDLGNPVPRQLLKAPLYVFEGKEVRAATVLPRLALVSNAWLPSLPIRISGIQSAYISRHAVSLRFRDGVEPTSGSFIFDGYGSYLVSSSYGVFKCLMLDPAASPDERALAIFRFAAENIVHSCVDKATVLPWARRTRYVRPDLLLNKLFLSDQPLALHCDHAAQVTAYLLHLAGYRVREVSVVNPTTDTGHVVMEVFLPVQGKWVMLDPDYGVIVTDRTGTPVGTSEIIDCKERVTTLEVRRVVEKRWTSNEFNVCEGYGGHLTWTSAASSERETVDGDSYYKVMDQCFLARREFTYRFDDGFDDTRLDVDIEGNAVNDDPVPAAKQVLKIEASRIAKIVPENGRDASMEGSNELRTSLRWVDRLSQLLVPVLQHQLERFGAQATGAYNFYKTRLDGGQLFLDYEIAVARELLSRPLGITRVDEVGSGFGQFPLLLGWNGFQTVGFESDRLRAKTARCLRAILDLTDPDLTRAITLSEDEFPSANVPLPGSNSMILTTNLVATRSEAQQAAIIAGMRKYSFALVDVQRLFEKRDSDTQQQAALALFSKAGFDKPQLFLDLGDRGRYYLFSSGPLVARQPEVQLADSQSDARAAA